MPNLRTLLVLFGCCLPLIKAHGTAPSMPESCEACLNEPTSGALIDPRTRFADVQVSLPANASSWPALQASLTIPPDCGESSYRGSRRLAGRRALITGGDSGIGRAIVIAFAREGARVAINYLPEEEVDAQALAVFLAKEGLEVVRLPGDLLNETFCTELVHQASEALGGLDLVVNNAGFVGPMFGPDFQPVSNLSSSQLDRVFRTNVYATLFITRAAVPLLPFGASIINTASIVASNPAASFVDYAASKAAVVSITRSLSKQLVRRGIRVNAVAPGLVYTPFLVSAAIDDVVLEELLSSYPSRRLEMPAEVAPLYVDLATADKTFVTGSIWGATGGLSGF